MTFLSSSRRRQGSMGLTGAALAALLSFAVAPGTAAAPAASAAAGPRAIDQAAVVLPRWMDQVREVIGDRPLNKIVMPGSHDAGSWSITDTSGVCDTASNATPAKDHPQLAAAISITQMSPIKTQLENGSRYLDLRVCKQNGKWFTYHGGPMGGLFFDDPATGRKGEINDVAAWIRDHPTEIVTIELRTSAPADDPGANTEAVRLLGQAIGTGRFADRNALSPRSTYNQFVAAGANVVLLDTKSTTSEPWSWPGGWAEGRDSYVENQDWGGLVLEALKNPTRNPAIDKISGTAINRMHQVLSTDYGDPNRLFVLSGAVDSTLAIPGALFDVVTHGMNYKPDGVPYMLKVAREHNTRLLAKLEGEWRHSFIAGNTNVVQIDYVDMSGRRADGSLIGSGDVSRAIIANNTPTTAPGTLMGAERGADGSWDAARTLPGAYTSPEFAGGERAVAAMPDGSLQLLAYGLDNRMYHNIRFTNGTWQGWNRVNSDAVDQRFNGGPLAAAGTPDGTMHAVAVDRDGNLLHTLRRPGGSWQEAGWAGVADGTGQVFKAKDVAVAGLPDNSVKVLAYGQNGAMRVTERMADGAWEKPGWTTVPGVGGPVFAGYDLSITGMADRSVQIAAIGLDGRVWHITRDRNGVFSPWGNPEWKPQDPMRATAVSIAALPDGTAQLVAAGLDGNAWHTTRPTTGKWAAFSMLTGPYHRPLAATGVGVAALPGGRVYTLARAR
ncbi:hypothetical protein [Streptomyces sp. NPDC047981]|uniref:hypothetical protein n=1 Tax=Streptomyces sp. NPDC047981 TaxID=3154610 RepID=UPI003428DD81